MLPKCGQSFKNWYLSRYKFSKFYNDLGKPMPFDVTLRDGLQALSKEEQNKFTTNNKLALYNKVTKIYNPKNIEVGSIVSEKVLPVFKDTIEICEMLHYFKDFQKTNSIEIKEKKQNIFVLVPNNEKLKNIIENQKIKYFSFITSVSNSFQYKNNKMKLEDSEKDIYEMVNQLNCKRKNKYIKLYISCINECPIQGKIDNDFIINRILKFNKMDIDNICLSDTCGSLTEKDFEYIVDTCAFFGFPLSKFSLHLHVKKDRENEIEKIIHKALDRKIINFDVSYLETGGCSVTMDKNKMVPNLSYDLYYKALYNYIISKT